MEGYESFVNGIVSIEEGTKLKEMGFSEPTHKAYYVKVESIGFWKYATNHNDSNLKVSLPTFEQRDAFMFKFKK